MSECTGVVTTGGLCNRHYLRKQKYGSTDLPARPTFLQRVEARIIPAGPDECWFWDGPHDRRGYATQTSSTPNGYMPVAVARILLGLVPGDGLVARHKCDNPPCVNRIHLLTGTRLDNVRDAVERDRLDRGEDHVNSKLTDAAVRAIRASGESNAALALRYGVCRATVRCAREGRTWVHV